MESEWIEKSNVILGMRHYSSSSWFPSCCRRESVRVLSNRTALAFFRASIVHVDGLDLCVLGVDRGWLICARESLGFDHLSLPRFF